MHSRYHRCALFLAIVTIAVAPTFAWSAVNGPHVTLFPWAGFVNYAKNVNVDDAPIYGGTLGLMFHRYVGIEGHFGWLSSHTNGGFTPWSLPGSPLPAEADVNLMHYGADLQVSLRPSAYVNPYLLVGWQEGKFDFQDPPTDSLEHWYENGWEYGAGIKFRFADRLAARFEFRDGLWKFPSPPAPVPPGEDQVDNLHFTGGLEFALGGSTHDVDTDNDGVGDRKDRCPDTPAGCRVDDHGCPIDTDKDGVCDGNDQCENTPAGIQVDEHGCPRDSDRDGVPDGTDQCADTPAGCQVDSRGCPVDTDKDGVCDGLDQCPDTPSGTTVDAKGCPNVKDSDGDGVNDDKDQCPDTPANLRVDADGCPIEVIETEKTLMETGMIRLEDVHFVTAKADIMDDDKPRLDTVGQVLLRWPQLKIEIGGHADWRGTRPYNQRLSEQRVESVMNYLLSRFPALHREQYTTRGYGEDKPIADNKTDQGMAKNRRVEFVVLNKDVLQEEVKKRRLLEKGEGTKP